MKLIPYDLRAAAGEEADSFLRTCLHAYEPMVS